MRFFLDTSAVAKRYVRESGSIWVDGLFRPRGRAGHSFFISQLTPVELVAALHRRSRANPKDLPPALVDHLIAWFARDVRRGRYEVVQIGDTILTRAVGLCRTHALRAYDSVQLACALTVAAEARIIKSNAPTFVCADNELIIAARAEGLPAGNPLDHA